MTTPDPNRPANSPHESPIADTGMFRRFVEEPETSAAARQSPPAWLWIVLAIAVIAIAVIVWLLAR